MSNRTKRKRRLPHFLSIIKRIPTRIDEKWANNNTHDESRRPTSFELITAQYEGLDDPEQVLV